MKNNKIGLIVMLMFALFVAAPSFSDNPVFDFIDNAVTNVEDTAVTVESDAGKAITTGAENVGKDYASCKDIISCAKDTGQAGLVVIDEKDDLQCEILSIQKLSDVDVSCIAGQIADCCKAGRTVDSWESCSEDKIPKAEIYIKKLIKKIASSNTTVTKAMCNTALKINEGHKIADAIIE